MTGFDELAEANGDDECRAWISRLLDAKPEVVAFVDKCLDGGGTGEYLGFLKGSFNLSFHIGFGERRQSALIRFAKPGHSTWREEKVANEVAVLRYLNEKTTIPLPYVRTWGLTEESPQKLGPFIIMDYIPGISLSKFLKQPTEDEEDDIILNPNIDDKILDTIYDQLAGYLLQISRLDFDRIGAISKDHSTNTWSVTGRPLTYNMNELATAASYPMDKFETAIFSSAQEYFRSIADLHLVHLYTQRNVADGAEDAKQRFIARKRFRQLIPEFCTHDTSPFKIFCDDMQPSNMLVDPDTLRITAVLDFEFTNAMPAQFVYDPPSWLLLLGPDIWLERYSKEEFLSRYEPRMEQFLRALERVEAQAALVDRQSEISLSAKMRDSWKSRRFWFNYAARKSLDVDAIYWGFLHQDGTGMEQFEESDLLEMNSLALIKVQQLEAYTKEWGIRFASPSGSDEETD